jgi:hypothetical protein
VENSLRTIQFDTAGEGRSGGGGVIEARRAGEVITGTIHTPGTGTARPSLPCLRRDSV